MPHGFEDVAAIMEATNAMRKECEKPLVSMAMGSIGSISRISGENFGSGITFGTVGAASAPGQFPIGELRSLLEALHRRIWRHNPKIVLCASIFGFTMHLSNDFEKRKLTDRAVD